MSEPRKAKIGQDVVFVDPVGQACPAVVTASWGWPSVNIVIVSRDENKTDTYGRQIERHTSIVHQSVQPAHGNYWRFTDEKPKETEVPF